MQDITDDPLTRLTALVRAERAALVAIARREGLSPEDAVECVQDALCDVLETDLGERMDEHAVARVKTVVRNRARNARRLHRVARPHLPIEPGTEPSATDALTEALLVHAEEVVRLRVCVASLCAVQRSVVMLRLLEERSGEDVAASLGVTRGYVDVLVHRAKGALSICMHHGARSSRGTRTPDVNAR